MESWRPTAWASRSAAASRAREAVAARGQEAAGVGDGVEGVRPCVAIGGATVGEGMLLFLPGRVEAQERLGDAREVGSDVGRLEGLDPDVGEERILQDGLEPGGVAGPAAGQLRDGQIIGPGDADQHLGAERTVVALQEGDVGRRDLEVGRHVRLREAPVTTQAP